MKAGPGSVNALVQTSSQSLIAIVRDSHEASTIGHAQLLLKVLGELLGPQLRVGWVDVVKAHLCTRATSVSMSDNYSFK